MVAQINAMTGNAGTYGGYTTDPTYTAPTGPAAFSYGLGDYTPSPAYQWQQDQARKAIEASAAARGSLQSGATMKALQDRAQQIAYQDFGNERQFAYGLSRDARADYQDDRDFGRGVFENDRNYLTSRFDRGSDDLFRFSGLGANSVNATGNAYLGVGNAGATAATNTGNAMAGNALAQGDIWSGVVGDVAGAAAGYLNGMGGTAGNVQRNAAHTSGGGSSPAWVPRF